MKAPIIPQGFSGVLLFLFLASAPNLFAQANSAIPTVSIRADPARTSEPLPTALVLPGQFIVARSGDRTQALQVFLSFGGTASSADYEPLPESLVIPAGAEAAKMRVLARSDELVEGTETVVAKLRGAPDATDPAVAIYKIDSARSEAKVEIADEDKGEPTIPVVSILADPAQTSEPSPLIRVAPGVFHLRRSGSTDGELLVWLSIAGTATPGRDYQALDEKVVFERGQSTVKLTVAAIDDELPEPDETVVAEIIDPPTAIAVKTYQISAEGSRAFVTIRDTDTGDSPATLKIVKPEPGATFPSGALIPIEALAVDPNGYIPRVEFYANEKLIGVSEITFIQAPTNGTPILHEIVYKEAPAGVSELVARAIDSLGRKVTSGPVRIIVGESSKASLTITSPKDGDEVPAGKPLEIGAVAIDPKGYIARVEFYDGTTLLGVSQIFFIVAPPPGTPIHHSFTWTNPPVGQHLLFARANTSEGMITSEPVRITAVLEDQPVDRVVLGITAPDPVALEHADDNPAVFRIARISGKRDIAVTAHLKIGGTAENGGDYSELPREVVIPAGREAVELVVKPVPDKAIEGEETVVIELLAPLCVKIYPPPADCYLIATDRGSARAIIREPNPANLPPGVIIASPKNGFVFEAGANVTIRAEAADRDGEIERLDIFGDGQLLASTKLRVVTTIWTNPPAGIHEIVGVALDDKGASSTSAVVHVMIRGREPWVRRELPEGYSAGVAFTVSLAAKPPGNIAGWAVEDRPPRGWRVDEVSHGGRFDESTGKVKFGPYTDNRERHLSYRVLPASDAAGNVEFEGVASADGRSEAIVGDHLLENVRSHHPADLDDNWRIVLDEVTRYAAHWRVSSEPMPSITYLTRAGMIWRNGEAYRFDGTAGAPPFCWSPLGRDTLAPLAASSATRTIEGRKVQIQIDPAPGSSASAVIEQLPKGWGAINVSDGGGFIPATSEIRWGVFMEGERRLVTFELAPTLALPDFSSLNGILSVDGSIFRIGGAKLGVETGASAEPRLARCERLQDGQIRLEFQGAANQLVEVETSVDLESWVKLDTRFLPQGRLDFTDDTAKSQGRRYYRLRAP